MDDADLGQTVRELQESVADLERRHNDLVLKAQILSLKAAGGGWGWDRFLSEPEFWENTYDSGMADCASRCVSNLQQANAACDANHTMGSTEWTDCRSVALAEATQCHARCSAANPVIP